MIAPSREDTPAKCNENIIRSTAPPEWDWMEESGGYTVHPVPAPLSTNALTSNNIKEGGSNQKLTLFNLGKAISGLPNSTGTK